jgi:hypothetical protein
MRRVSEEHTLAEKEKFKKATAFFAAAFCIKKMYFNLPFLN